MSAANDTKQWIGYAVFVLACVFLAFLAGMFVSIMQVFPYPAIQASVGELNQTLNENSEFSDEHFLNKARNDDAGVTVYQSERVQPGVTLVTGYWRAGSDWQPAIRLINFAGETLHEWQVHPNQIWPESPHDDRVKGTYNKPTNYVHGAQLLSGGDVVFNIEYLGMVRLNACGEVKWKVPYRLHHSIDIDDDGNIWAAGLVWRDEEMAEYIHLKPPFVDERLVQVSPDGEILRDISVLDALYDAGYDGTFVINQKRYDITHMNDVEVLSADMADAFPMFSAGDILVSLRKFSLVLVVDAKTERVKWHFQHPLIHQHDPDFESDGRIVIFDNHDDLTADGSRGGRTQILRVDPASNTFERIYPAERYPYDDSRIFYTQFGGKHQLLENGNRLITEAMAGRVFEVSSAGETVWNWVVESRDGDRITEVLEGSRYPASAADFTVSLECR